MDLIAALPEIILAVGAMAMLMIGVCCESKKENGNVCLKTSALSMVSKGSILIIVLSVASIFYAQENLGTFFNGLFVSDKFSICIKAILLFSGGTVLLMSNNYLEQSEGKVGFEYPILILLSLCGMLIMVSANDLMSLYLGIELQSLSLYVMAAMRRDSERAAEAGMKYFVLGALASGLLLYGCSLVYGFSGSTNFNLIAENLAAQGELSKGLIVGLVLVIVGLAFKMSAAPFHMWAPDVYEGVPTPVTAYFAIVPKLAVAAVLLRIFTTPFAEFAEHWQDIIIIISLVSMTVGALAGIWQTNIKRLLAYSSIANMGYAMVGIAAISVIGTQSVIAFFLIYILTTIGIFTFILSITTRSNDGEHTLEKIDHLKGLAKSNPISAMLLALMMISMIGLPFPPYAGFFGKFFIFHAAMDSSLYALAVFGVLSSVIASYYYLRIIKLMYFDELPKNIKLEVNIPSHVKLILFMVTIISLAIFLDPALLMDIAKTAAESI